MKKSYEALSVDVVKFEAEDIITASGTLTDQDPNGGDSGDKGGELNPGQGEL